MLVLHTKENNSVTVQKSFLCPHCFASIQYKSFKEDNLITVSPDLCTECNKILPNAELIEKNIKHRLNYFNNTVV
jgi:hypothetical protein